MNLEKEIFDISLQDIIPNRFQPREIFNDTELSELSESIKQHGVIQPIIVRKVGDKYEIIAGERRFRASQMAGKETIPALVRDIDDKEAAKIALLENLQRSNLTPIEEAKTYQTILKIDNITQDELASNLGRSQSTIANKLRLLTLNEEVQTALLNSQISERHARSLLGLTNDQQTQLLHKTIAEKLTVRQLDEEVMKITGKTPDNTNNEMTVDMNGGIINNQFENINNGNISYPNNQTSSVGVINTTIPEIGANNQQTEPIINVPTPEIGTNNQQTEPVINIPTIDIPQNVQNPVLNNEVIQPLGENQQVFNTEPQVALSNNLQNMQSEENIEQPLITEIEKPSTLANNEQIENQQENIFDKLRVNRDETNIENKYDLKTPDLSSIMNGQINNEEQNNNYNDIYDLRFAINNFRQAVQNTEKFGFKVSTTENDIGDKYQIVIEIEKK